MGEKHLPSGSYEGLNNSSTREDSLYFSGRTLNVKTTDGFNIIFNIPDRHPIVNGCLRLYHNMPESSQEVIIRFFDIYIFIEIYNPVFITTEKIPKNNLILL